MDRATIFIVGGVVLALIGVLAAAAWGTYRIVRGAKGPREHAFLVKASVVFWVLVSGFTAVMMFIPMPQRRLLWIPMAILLSLGSCYVMNKQERIREEEAQQAP